MRGSADTAGMPDVKSLLAFFCFEFASKDQPLGIWLESTPDFSHSEMRVARGPFFGMRFGRVLFSGISPFFSCGRASRPQFRQAK